MVLSALRFLLEIKVKPDNKLAACVDGNISFQ